ncbi:MAG TPA: WYL domain-containing protein, partial [Solirubrobacteraceae bacterium]|nr:WYL domain-containing protein [Solirubrobacteraceae bacterium]
RIRVHAPAAQVAPHVPPRQATVTPDGPDACVLTSAGGWTRQFLVWAALLDHELTVLDPPELVAEARAVGDRLVRAQPTSSGSAGSAVHSASDAS